jgi:hypothetical protein
MADDASPDQAQQQSAEQLPGPAIAPVEWRLSLEDSWDQADLRSAERW